MLPEKDKYVSTAKIKINYFLFDYLQVVEQRFIYRFSSQFRIENSEEFRNYLTIT